MADQYGLGNLSGATLENLVGQWAAKDSTNAVAWIKDRPAGEQRDRMFANVAMGLAQTSPSQAAEMAVTQIPAGNIQDDAVTSVVYQWARSDLSGAKAWVEQFPEGTLRDRALNELKGIEQYQQQANAPKP
jgi:hypothetical protein